MFRSAIAWRAAGFALTVFATNISCAQGSQTQAISDVADLSNRQSVCSENRGQHCVVLVLGGGGARGGAHIGVLKFLEEQNITVDAIVGTSIGSFVGGLYASGKSADEIKQLFSEADWNSGFQDDLNRNQTPNRRKRQLDNFPIHLDLGLGAGGIKLPKGFLRGQGMKNLIDLMLGRFPHFESFDQLPIPFRAIAADVETGVQIVLDSGDLATALHISMSLPGILRPIEQDGRLLVDGGIANNLPISVAKSLGADIVIAVQIGSPALEQDELRSGVTIFSQTAALLVRKNVAYQKTLLTDNDIYIEPNIENVGLLSFDNTLEAVNAGYLAARQVFSASEIFASLPNRNSETQTENVALDNEATIDRIVLSNNSRLGDDYVLQRMNLHQGQVYSLQQLQTGTDRLYGQGTIARINTSFETIDGEDILDIDVEEKEWGPTYLDFKLTFEDDFDTFSRYQLGLSSRVTNLSAYGAEWYTTVEFGTEKYFRSELYWPIKNSGFFWQASGTYDRQVAEVKQDEIPLGTIVTSQSGVIGGLGWNSTDRFDLILSAIAIDGKLELTELLAASVMQDEIDFSRLGLMLAMNVDSLDHANFPKSGWKVDANITRSKDEFLILDDYTTRADVEINGVFSLGRHSFRNLIRYQSTISDDPTSLLGAFTLGGFLNLSGSERRSLAGQHVRFFSSVYTYELAANDFGAIDLPLYLGFSVESGGAWNDRDDIDYSDLTHAGSVFVGWDSPIGPAYLAYGRTDNGDKSLYAFVGVVF